MSTAKRRLEEEIRLEDLKTESEDDQQNARNCEIEEKEQAEEDAAIEAAEVEGYIEDYRDSLEQEEIEQAIEDDAIAAVEDHPED